MFFSPMEQFDLVPLFLFKIEFINSILSFIQTYGLATNHIESIYFLTKYHVGYWMDFFPDYFETDTLKDFYGREIPYMYFYGITPEYWDNTDIIGFNFGRQLIKQFSFFFLTNYTLYLFLSLGFISVLFLLSINLSKFIPTISQLLLESFYSLCLLVVKEQAGLRGVKYLFVFLFLFLFILTSNFLGLLPFSFTTTSLLFQNFYLAFSLFLGVLFLSLVNLGYSFIYVFLPKGVPSWLLPLLFVIEVISYISRPISLSVRLFANMLAGHSLLFILSSFVVSMINKGTILFIVPLFLIVPIVLLEIGIAGLQAYVFTILSAIYLNSALYKH